MTNPILEKLVRFQRPEHVLPFAQNLDAQTLAGIFGATETEYRAVRDDLDRQRAEAAARIADAPATEAYLRALPFEDNAHLVAVGESTTADRLSWFEILSTLLERYRPDLQLRMTNLAISGATTTQALGMLPAIRRLTPDWVFCMLGTNDAQRFDAPAGPLLVDPEETRRNLTELRTRAVPNGDARWVWLAPTPVDEERIARFPFFAGSGISWSNADLNELTHMLPTGDDFVIDTSTAVRTGDPDALADDGLHPSASAHETLAMQVLEALAGAGR
jgi:acyl-CoA thioesterase-1